MHSFKCAVAVAVLLQCFAPVLCTYTFQVRAVSYRNTQSKNGIGCCCDDCNMDSCSGGYLCDNRFNFCLRSYGTSHDNNANNCPRGMIRTSVIYSNNDNFNFPSPMGGVPNPMSFSGGNWPGSFQLYIQVWDYDNVNADDEVNDIYAQEFLSVSSLWTTRTYIGNIRQYTTVSITLSFRVQCNTNYYGSNCATYCVPMDNNNGHYTCSSTGQKICLTGWSNPTGDCRTSLPVGPPVDPPPESVPNPSSDGVATAEDSLATAAGGTTGAGGLNTDQTIGISVGLVGAAAAIVAAIITTCKCCVC